MPRLYPETMILGKRPDRGANISLGMLPVRADQELPEDWRDVRLQDRSRRIITTSPLGPNGARGAKVLKDMGFTNNTTIAWQFA